MTKKREKEVNARVSRAYARACAGVQIDMLDIGRVMAKGREALAAGADDAGLEGAIRAFVDTIQKN